MNKLYANITRTIVSQDLKLTELAVSINDNYTNLLLLEENCKPSLRLSSTMH